MYKKHILYLGILYKKKVFEKCAVAPNLTQHNLLNQDYSIYLPFFQR